MRVVAATHRDLEDAVRAGHFRQDLYYRLRVVAIDLPPLRDRGPAEAPALALHFTDDFARRYQRPKPHFSDEAWRALLSHPFPGNVRELEAWMESAVVTSPEGNITAESLPRSRRRPPTCPMGTGAGAPAPEPAPTLTLDEAMRRHAEAVLDSVGGNKTEAARRLGIGRNRLARSSRFREPVLSSAEPVASRAQQRSRLRCTAAYSTCCVQFRRQRHTGST